MTSPCTRYSTLDDIRRHRAIFIGLVIALTIWCGVDVARRAIIDPLRPSQHMTDFTVYTEAGAAFFDGREPYDVANIRGWKYLYPPLFALLVAPLAYLSTPWQATVWFALSSLMAFGCYFECRRLVDAFCRDRDGDRDRGNEMVPVAPFREEPKGGPSWLIITALAAALFPAFNCLQRGQMGLALVYPLLLGFRLMWRGESRVAQIAGGFLLALPVALKLTPALPALVALASVLIADLSARFGMRSAECGVDEKQFASALPLRAPHSAFRTSSPLLAFVAGLLVFFLVLPAGLIGWSANLRHLQTWYVRVASRVDDVRADDFGGDVASVRNQSLFNATYRCGNWVAHQFFGGPDDVHMDVKQAAMPMDAPVVAHFLTAARIAALAALAVVVLVAGRGSNLLLQGAAFGLAGVATLVVSPVSRGHYFVFWVPAVVFVPLWFHAIGRARTAFALAVIPAVLTILHYAASSHAGRVGLLGLGTTVWYFTTCQQIWRHRTVAAIAGMPRLDLPLAEDRELRAA